MPKAEKVETDLICPECLGKLRYEFTNKSNVVVDSILLKCDNCGHSSYLDVPINPLVKAYRKSKAKFENREGSWRNKVFNWLGLCACTNSYHGHRTGVHARNKKGITLCEKCNKVISEAY